MNVVKFNNVDVLANMQMGGGGNTYMGSNIAPLADHVGIP